MTTLPDGLRQRRHLLITMLTACAWHDTPAGPTPVVAGLRTFLGGWLGIGRLVVGMARQGYDLQLTRYGDEGWRATFYPAGRGHSVTSAVGSAWGARAADRGPAGGVGEPAEARGGGDMMDLAGKYVVIWLSPEAIETFLGIPGPSEDTAMDDVDRYRPGRRRGGAGAVGPSEARPAPQR